MSCSKQNTQITRRSTFGRNTTEHKVVVSFTEYDDTSLNELEMLETIITLKDNKQISVDKHSFRITGAYSSKLFECTNCKEWPIHGNRFHYIQVDYCEGCWRKSGKDSSNATIFKEPGSIPYLLEDEDVREEEEEEEDINIDTNTTESNDQVSCKVLYAYQGEKEDELEINVDDIITNVDRSSLESNWAKGLCNGKFGYFPSNYVEIYNPFVVPRTMKPQPVCRNKHIHTAHPQLASEGTTWHPADGSHDHESFIISQAKRMKNGLWRDPDFPASRNILKNRHINDNNIVWRRPSEIADNPRLFVDGSVANDIKQGELGDCYFMAALGIISERKVLMDQLVVSAHPEYGFYQFQFFQNGHWVTITIDDLLPRNEIKGYVPNLIYGKCVDENEFWVPLIEKAFAKLHGSYEAISGGKVGEALVTLTGAVAKSKSMQVKKKTRIRELIYGGISKGWMFGISVSDVALQKRGLLRSASNLGIVTSHAYSILDAQKANDSDIIKLRNPHATDEWKGPWSDNDNKRWSNYLREKLHAVPADDGTFWMSFDDFYQYFDDLQVCRLYDRNFHRYLVRGYWINTQSMDDGPFFAIHSDSRSNVEICLHLVQDEIHRRNSDYSSIAIFIKKYSEEYDDPKKIWEEGTYLTPLKGNARSFFETKNVVKDFTLEPNTCIIINTSIMDGKDLGFTLMIYSSFAIHITKLGH